MTLAPAVLFDLKLKRDEARVAKGAFVQTDKELRKKEAWSLAVGAYGSDLLDEVLHLGEVKQLHMQEIARLKAEVREFPSAISADAPPTDRDAAAGASDKYPIRVFWNEEDRGWIAEAIDFEGCSAFGETREEACAETEHAIAAWIEATANAGNPAPEPSTRRLDSTHGHHSATDALRQIAALRHSLPRETVSPTNAYEAFDCLNRHIISIFDLADAALAGGHQDRTAPAGTEARR